MKKFLNIFLAVLITLFSFPINGLSVSAEEKVYDDIRDGEYTLTAKLLKENSDEVSTAAQYMSNQVLLNITNGKAELTFFIPNTPGMNFNDFQLEGKRATINSGTGKHDGTVKEGNYYIFEVNELKEKLTSKVSYEVPFINLNHENVPMDIILVGLDELPKVVNEPENPEENDGNENGDNDGSNNGGGTTEPEEDQEPVEEDPKSDDNEEDSQFKLDDGYYSFDVTYLHSDNDNQSSMRDYLGNTAFVEAKDGKYELTVTVTDKNAVTKLQVNGKNPFEVVEDENGRYERFELSEIDLITNAFVKYQAHLPNGNVHKGTATFRISLGEESQTSVAATDKPGYGLEPTAFSLNDGAYMFDVTYLHSDNDNQSLMRDYLGNTAFVEAKDGKYELTVTVTDKNAVTKLQVNGKNPIEVVEDENGRYERFELSEIDLITDAYVEYQAHLPNGKIHNGTATFRIALDRYSIDPVNEEDKPGYNLIPNISVDLGQEIDVSNTNKITINGDEKSQIIIPDSLPENVKVTIESQKDNVKNIDNLILAGEVYNFEFKGLNDFSGKFTLVLGFDASKYSTDEYNIAIYYYNESNDEWEIVDNSRVEDGVVIAEVEHFSTYGVFATEKDSKDDDNTEDQTGGQSDEQSEKEEKTPSKEEILTPDRVYEIDYTILHENGLEPSVANEYFTGKALILEKNGKKYAHLTITGKEFVRELANKYGNAILVKEIDENTIVVQLRVEDDLSDMILDMHIVVPKDIFPGFPGYDEEHKAILSFAKESLNEIPVGNHKLVASGNTNNLNGPFIEGAETPEGPVQDNNGKQPGKPSDFGDNGGNGDGDKSSDKKQSDNPKTGDTSQVMFFTTLLIASLITLVIQIRRRLVTSD